MDLQDTPPVNPVILSKLFDFFAKFMQEITVKLLLWTPSRLPRRNFRKNRSEFNRR